MEKLKETVLEDNDIVNHLQMLHVVAEIYEKVNELVTWADNITLLLLKSGVLKQNKIGGIEWKSNESNQSSAERE